MSDEVGELPEHVRRNRAARDRVLDLVEVRPPPDATTRYSQLASLDWARRWPSEQVWKARRIRP